MPFKIRVELCRTFHRQFNLDEALLYLTLLQTPAILTQDTTSLIATPLPKKSATATVQ